MPRQSKNLSDKDLEIRTAAEEDLSYFIHLVHPNRVLGSVHEEVIRWWTRPNRKSHQLLLLPRDHQKSALLAYRVAWAITRNPAIRVLYVSRTSTLAVKQLKFIKDILTSDTYRRYWPEMINPKEAKREKWTATEISVDHPKRKQENIRDSTVFTAGLTTNIVGLHCDVVVLDDVVVDDTAYSEEGRKQLEIQYSYLASIEGTNGEEWVAGTRYHPNDLYNTMMNITVDKFDSAGNLVESTPLYEVFCKPVEDKGDGTGEFLWPRQRRSDGQFFGFDAGILAKKRAQYLDVSQFRAQYYNDPLSIGSSGITQEMFQYYDRVFLNRNRGQWYFRNRKLNITAAVDFAFSTQRKSDYSAIVVVGMDAEHKYYVLDVVRFQTDKISDYFSHIFALYKKWGFPKLIAEVSSAQQVIVNDLKLNYVMKHGLPLVIEDFKPSSKQGTKEERILSILQPKYAHRQVYHYHGGYCQLLEEELLSKNPPHDDIKDCLATAMEKLLPPVQQQIYQPQVNYREFINQRFGGIA